MPKQNLNRPKIACLLVNYRGFRSSERMSAVLLGPQPYGADLLIDEPGILAGAQVPFRVNSAREEELITGSAALFDPCLNTRPGGIEDFELYRAARLLLDHGRSAQRLPTAENFGDFDFDEVPAAQLAIDCQIEKRTISQSALSI